MKITKVKYDETIFVEYELDRPGGGVDTFSIDSPEAPRPELAAALQNLTPYVLTLCELPEAWGDNLVVHGLRCIYSDAGTGVAIQTSRPLPGLKKPLGLNTPVVFLDGRTNLAEAVDAVCTEAQAYVKGQRAQQELPGCAPEFYNDNVFDDDEPEGEE